MWCRGGFGCGCGEVEVVAQSVVHARGGGCAEGGQGLVGGVGGGDDAERLMVRCQCAILVVVP